MKQGYLQRQSFVWSFGKVALMNQPFTKSAITLALEGRWRNRPALL